MQRGSPATFSAEDTAEDDLFGLQIQIGAAAAGDKFVLKPLNAAARSTQMATNRAEDLALAGPIRGEFNATNLGNGRVDGLKVFNTDSASSAPTESSIVNGPYTVTYMGQDSLTNEYLFEITDSTNAVLGETRFATNNF